MAAVLVTVMLTYFLAAWAKMRFGGWDWATGATLTRAVLRRGTDLSMWTLDVPGLLPAAQWLMLAFEFAAPLMLLVRTDRARVGLVLFLLGFHVMVYVGVGIIFLPHCVAILSILPWERLTAPPSGPERAGPGPAEHPVVGQRRRTSSSGTSLKFCAPPSLLPSCTTRTPAGNDGPRSAVETSIPSVSSVPSTTPPATTRKLPT
jgi:hypothetical protein